MTERNAQKDWREDETTAVPPLIKDRRIASAPLLARREFSKDDRYRSFVPGRPHLEVATPTRESEKAEIRI